VPLRAHAFERCFALVRYGFHHEVKISGPGAYTAVKHFSMGRSGWEMAYVMPDNRTTYLAADISGGGFWKFVATTAGDLSAGVLSCAAVTQTSSANGGAFTVNWISMGTTNDATILNAVNGTANGGASQITFDDIFIIDLPTGNTTGACNTGFISINTAYSYTVNGVRYYNECLKLNTTTPNAAMLAATLETNRYSAMLGCTAEFNKWEGITYSVKRKQLYTALSYWTGGGMLPTTNAAGAPNTADIGGSQDVSLAAVPCGCVYYLNVDATYSATDMTALVCGTSQAADSNGNTCSVNGIASPDNVAVLEDFDTLIIGEDTSNHRVDYIWQYTFPNAAGSGSPVNGTLTPIFTTPLGSETTSPYWHNMGNGMGYMSLVTQHPYGESDNAWAAMPTSSGTAGYMGYIGPIPIPGPAGTSRNAAFITPTAITSATTPATCSSSNTLAFAPVATNPSAAVSNNPQVTNSATVNGVATPLSGFQVLARSGWTDTNGNVLGLMLVRAGVHARVLRRRGQCCILALLAR
jgi:hypothetical protein